MACFSDSPIFDTNKVQYYTQKKMWENIQHLIPKDKVIFEAFLLNSKSKSKSYWEELGYKVVGNDKLDFLNDELPEFDIVCSNPPFKRDIKTKILKKLVELDKPFIIVINIMNIFSKYFREIFKNKFEDLQIIKPVGKIVFEEYDEETDTLKKCGDPAFYNCYLSYKMNIPEKDLWLKIN